MHGKREPPLRTALRPLVQRLQRVIDRVPSAEPGETDFGAFNTAWQEYYFVGFAQFERLLYERAKRSSRVAEELVPVAISHHNLHRLVEVLQQEIGDRKLSETNVPERILDLTESLTGLSALLQRTCQKGDSYARPT